MKWSVYIKGVRRRGTSKALGRTASYVNDNTLMDVCLSRHYTPVFVALAVLCVCDVCVALRMLLMLTWTHAYY